MQPDWPYTELVPGARSRPPRRRGSPPLSSGRKPPPLTRRLFARLPRTPGYGEAVCVLLDCLANMALTTVQFGRPVHSADAGTDRAEAVNDVEQDIVGLADADGAVEEVEARALAALGL